MELAIALRGVSKKYVMYKSGHQRLVEALHPFRKKSHEEFWALRDISIEIPRGETVGILGVNGSGKSTLLQLICSIMEPTSGEIVVNGRVAALLELGAGFNPNLTGRENAEMNCSILGMTTAQVRDTMPLIESFADIGAFFDQPVRTYSSGMFMRVAFSAAIHTDPDILVIDEALAVGDARFRQKCSKKFDQFRAAGKTIILVTHDRHAVPRLCTRAIMLNAGTVFASGDPQTVTEQYSKFLQLGLDRDAAEDADTPSPSRPGIESVAASALRCAGEAGRYYNKNEFRYGQGGATIIDFHMGLDDGSEPDVFAPGSRVRIDLTVRYDRRVDSPLIGYGIQSGTGLLVASTHSGWLGAPLMAREAGSIVSYRFALSLNLAAGDWFVNLAVAADQQDLLDTREAVMHFVVRSSRPTAALVSLDSSITEGT